MDNNFNMSTTLCINTRDYIQIITHPNGDTESIILHHMKEDNTYEEITKKEEVIKFLQESGFDDKQIEGFYGHIAGYNIPSHTNTDTIEIEGAEVSEIEHWPNEYPDGGETFKHVLIIDIFEMSFMYTITDKKILLESYAVKDIRLRFWINIQWGNIEPFNFSSPTDITQFLPYKSWEEYFSVESIKNYLIKHGVDKKLLIFEEEK